MEVAYTSNVVISGYTIVLYNGNGGVVYSTTPVPTGTLVAGGLYLSVLTYPTDGIQNGSPDGLALVNGSGNVVEFLSYEGTIVAVGGPASGLTSTPLGVEETGTTPVGYSLQRGGSGCQGSAFTWQSPRPKTQGSVNTGQTVSCALTPTRIPTQTPTSVPTKTPTRVPTKVPTKLPTPTSVTSIKFMTYNIKEGGTLGTAWKDIVKAENADILVFTEVGNWDDNNNLLLNQYLNEFNSYFVGETPYVIPFKV